MTRPKDTTTFCDHCGEEEQTIMMYHFGSLAFSVNSCCEGESASLCESCYISFGEPEEDSSDWDSKH